MKAQTLPPSIPYEDRQAASFALIEVADRMMRGAQSLMLKSARVIDPDPKSLGRTLAGLRKYGGYGMPCADEMPKIEALLQGMSEAEYLADYDKRQLKREHEQCLEGRRSERFWEKEHEHRKRVEKALMQLAAEVLTPAKQARLKEISEAFYCRKELPVVHVEGNVLEGPWDNAS